MTREERQQIYAALAAPFPEEAIERTDGHVTGRGYSTTGIKYQFIANRLCEVLGVGCFRVERYLTVKETETAKKRAAFDATCEVKLQLGEWVDGHFMPFAEAVGDGGHTALHEADARKGAFTNGFKKAAAFFGVGKQAYEGTIDDDNVSAADASEPASSHPAPASAASRPCRGAAPPERNRLTSQQYDALWSIARGRGLDERTFRAQVRRTYGVEVDFLTRDQAGELIGTLSNGHTAREGR